MRFLIEFVRKPNALYAGISTGQILCIVMILGALLLAYKKNFWKKENTHHS
jgi:prolipoprotein diacylglyceryltransferase